MKNETAFRKNRVDPFLRKLRNTSAMTIQQKAIGGHPDKVLCVMGRFVALELKARGEKVTALQRETLLGFQKRGHGISLVANPDNWQDICNALQKLDRGEDIVIQAHLQPGLEPRLPDGGSQAAPDAD